MRIMVLRLIWILILCSPVCAAETLPVDELFTTTPLFAGGLVMFGSSEAGGHGGHLRAYAADNPVSGMLWDAAEHIPRPGTGTEPGSFVGSDPPLRVDPVNRYRTLLTGQEGQTLVPLNGLMAAALQPALAVDSVAAAEALINTVRGRLGCTVDNPVGTADNPVRLWGISRSAPAWVGDSPVLASIEPRPDVVYVGAEDGLLHAFQLVRSVDGLMLEGTELWAYLPGFLLPSVKDQPFTEPEAPVAVHVDGTPVVGDYFVDLDDDGRREWRTLLVATASRLLSGRSGLFVLDVTDPYRPRLLWERLLPGDDTGLTRGVTVGMHGPPGQEVPTIFLSAGYNRSSGNGRIADSFGLHLAAFALVSGEPFWQFRSPYPAEASLVAAAPAVPVLMDRGTEAPSDYLICGDLAGRLWALDPDTGQPLGDGPVYVVPSGAAEPIGARVAVRGNQVVFGTGGAAHADARRTYALYAVAIDSEAGRLLWTYPLPPGEKVWSMPVVDALGNLLIGTASGYQPDRPAADRTAGRLLLVRADGETVVQTALAAASVARTAMQDNALVAVALTGEVRQFGQPASSEPSAATGPARVRVLSWRLR